MLCCLALAYRVNIQSRARNDAPRLWVFHQELLQFDVFVIRKIQSPHALESR